MQLSPARGWPGCAHRPGAPAATITADQTGAEATHRVGRSATLTTGRTSTQVAPPIRRPQPGSLPNWAGAQVARPAGQARRMHAPPTKHAHHRPDTPQAAPAARQNAHNRQAPRHATSPTRQARQRLPRPGRPAGAHTIDRAARSDPHRQPRTPASTLTTNWAGPQHAPARQRTPRHADHHPDMPAGSSADQACSPAERALPQPP